MNIPLLNRMITIQKQTAVTDAIGNHTNTWADYYTCHATVSNETSSEDETAGVTVDNTNSDFTIRYCALSSAVTATEYRVVMDGELFDILSVDHMNFKRKNIKLRCRKVRR